MSLTAPCAQSDSQSEDGVEGGWGEGRLLTHFLTGVCGWEVENPPYSYKRQTEKNIPMHII